MKVDPYAPRSWSRAVARVEVNFDLFSCAPDPTALPQSVCHGFAAMKAGRPAADLRGWHRTGIGVCRTAGVGGGRRGAHGRDRRVAAGGE